MKKILRFCAVALSMAGVVPLAYGQQYGNEWIDYTKSYYKFKVGGNGVFRITKSGLDAAGVPATVTGANFILYRNGQEVPLYVSTSGTFGTSDYITFCGKKNDGSLDLELYGNNNDLQANPNMSMFNDTASYYLTYDNQTGHARYGQQTNNVTPGLTPETYCMATAVNNYRTNFLYGKSFSASSEANLFTSQFDGGEGWVASRELSNAILTYTLATPNLVNTAPVPAVFNTNLLAQSYYDVHTASIQLQNLPVSTNTSYDVNLRIRDFNVPLNQLATGGTQTIKYTPVSSPGSDLKDVYGVSFISLDYPRDYNFSGLSFFGFKLKNGQQYLELTNVSSSSSRLYDITNQSWYTADVLGTTHRFNLATATGDRQFVWIADEDNLSVALTAVKKIQFTDYSQAASQGDYIIISHEDYMPSSGPNYIQDYKTYRSSAAGGSHKVVTVSVGDLYDQFAYGTDFHPLSVKHFLKYAYDRWSTVKPATAFIIGKGVGVDLYPGYLSNRTAYSFSAVPTYGYPGSDVDMVNFGPNMEQAISIGRFSAWNAGEINAYLTKVKAYESGKQMSGAPTDATELWKKKILHIAGGSDALLQSQILLPNLEQGRVIIEDTMFGGVVTTIAKNTTNPVDLVGSRTIDSMINSGVAFITFHGHASSTGFDYNLNSPDQYTSMPRVPVFMALGCDVSQIFLLAAQKTISEQYVLSQTGGSIIMLAANSGNYTNFHNLYIQAFYENMGRWRYGSTIGGQYQGAYDSVLHTYPPGNPANKFFLAHVESMLLQGDPAVGVYSADKPDFHVNAQNISSVPAIVNTSVDSFKLRIVAFNLGKAVNGNVIVKVEHTNPAGVTTTITNATVTNLHSLDTLLVNVPVNKLTDIGINKYKVTIDAPDQYVEMSETNNTATLELFIYSESLIPVYPKEFAIVNTQGVELKASTLNPFNPTGRYRMEIDTTELFNSPFKQSTTMNGPGGVIKWKPSIAYKDSTVYYWRAAFDSTINGLYQWGNSSFIYLANSASGGWNQSHYYQYKKDNGQSMYLDTTRLFQFNPNNLKLTASNKVVTSISQVSYTEILLNDTLASRFACDQSNTLQVMVIDSATGMTWTSGGAGVPPHANTPCNNNTRAYRMFEFSITNQTARENARKFIQDSIPNGHYVLIRNVMYNLVYQPSFIDTWKNDTLLYGSGNSLYFALKNIGFTMVDSLYSKHAFMFFRRKGRTDYPVYQAVAPTDTNILQKEFIIPINGTNGSYYSTVIGPATAWQTMKWRTSSKIDTASSNDSSYVRIIGIESSGNETPVYAGNERDVNIQTVSAGTYPKLRLEWYARDTITRSSPQLDYWRVLYSPYPEAALNPALYLSFKDSIGVGQPALLGVAIENLTPVPMDSMLVKYSLIDANGTSHPLNSVRYRKLPGLDTLHAVFSFDASSWKGKNILFVEANPNNDQIEEYHPNNLGYVPFVVLGDDLNPVLDVTFDGIHILDKDIVSARPFIKVLMKDDNKVLALDDTALLNVYIRYPQDPQGTRRRIPFDGSVCRFIPATIGSNGKNEAYIEYRPTLTQDSTYELFVNGMDKAGNLTGGTTTDYKISFNVFNKSTITNVLNYPNPFSTSTAFVFTITGYRIPSQFKIQIMTVTGKVVREITKAELGPLNIGRNITEYKWDGRDQYGQMLGNGAYLYRVITSIDGTDVEHRQSGADAFFKNGYGKLYIMR